MKTLIIFAIVFVLAIQCQAKYVGSGIYSYTDEKGKTIKITYVEDDDGVHITSHNLPPEEEKKIVDQIKNQNAQMQQQLNQQLSQLNQQLSQQFSQFGPQYQQFHPQAFYPYFNFGSIPVVPNYNTFPPFPFFNPYIRKNPTYLYK